MAETHEAEALLQAIGTLLPFANGSAGDVVTHLRRTLGVLVSGADVPPDPAPRVHREAPRPAPNGLTIGARRVDPSWPGIRDRVQAAMTARSMGPTALARVVEIPPGTLRKYLADTAPPVTVKARLLAWVDQVAVAPPEVPEPPAARAARPPPARAQEGTAPPPVPFPGSRAPFRLGAAEVAARA